LTYSKKVHAKLLKQSREQHVLKRLLSNTIRATTFMTAALIASHGLAAGPGGPKVDHFNGYLINEDDGKMSKNVATQSDQIEANNQNGTGTQIIVDIFVKGAKNQLYENNPFLYVVVSKMLANVGDPPMLDTGFPINFIGNKGQTVRTVVIEHNCEGFTIEAYTMIGDKRVSELTKTFNITCGD